MFKAAAGVDIRHVPFKGAGAAIGEDVGPGGERQSALIPAALMTRAQVANSVFIDAAICSGELPTGS